MKSLKTLRGVTIGILLAAICLVFTISEFSSKVEATTQESHAIDMSIVQSTSAVKPNALNPAPPDETVTLVCMVPSWGGNGL